MRCFEQCFGHAGCSFDVWYDKHGACRLASCVCPLAASSRDASSGTASLWFQGHTCCTQPYHQDPQVSAFWHIMCTPKKVTCVGFMDGVHVNAQWSEQLCNVTCCFTLDAQLTIFPVEPHSTMQSSMHLTFVALLVVYTCCTYLDTFQVGHTKADIVHAQTHSITCHKVTI